MGTSLDLLKRLSDEKVTFVIVGGMAGVVHGSAIVTEDLDLCIPFEPENLSRILSALRDLHPCWRMRPDQPSLTNDASKLVNFKNLYLATDWGQVDFLSEITGVGSYAEVAQHAITIDLAGCSCLVLDLQALIRSKTALGRPKDLRAAEELKALKNRINRTGPNDTSES